MRSGVCMKEASWELKQDQEAHLSVTVQKDEQRLLQVAQTRTVPLLGLHLWHLNQTALCLVLRQQTVGLSWHRVAAGVEAVRISGLSTLEERAADPLLRVCAA